MNVGARDDFWESVPVAREAWISLYFISGSIFLILGAIYGVLITRDLRQPSPKIPGFGAANVLFTSATLLRGFGNIGWGIFIVLKETTLNPVIDTTLNGLPGYFMTLSYCLIFFLWCSICVNLLMNDASGFYSNLRNWHTACLSVIGICAASLIIAMAVVRGNTETLHHIEVWSAVIRDLFTFGFIVFFTAKLIRILRNKARLCDFRCDESVMCLMSICISACVMVRASSILIYFYGFVYGHSGDSARRWGLGSLVNTVIGLLVCELTPICVVFAGRRKSGLLSVYDPLN